MPNIDKNYISKLKVPNSCVCVILDGVHKSELSDKCDGFVFDQQTLNIPANAKIEKPIHLLFITSQNCNQKINIVAAPNSSFVLIEEHVSLKASPYSSNATFNITAKNSSEITYYKLQAENSFATHNAQTNIKLEKNSKVISGFIGKGAKIARDTLHVELVEENASYSAIGIIALHDTQTLSYQTHIEHLAPNCTSNVLFKGLINDEAIGNFRCLVVAHPGAIKTETHVTNKNLLLSETAIMNTAPELEIYTDDVICTHGATVGQLDQEAIFYLRSRGLAENIATKLLTNAFAQEIIDQFIEPFRPKINLDIAYEH
ncbi:MAG: FeS assembly protein SufD [uncultured bacterium]|nr:MAG: FeS assembly protein SufD [uncultured bacterium]